MVPATRACEYLPCGQHFTMEKRGGARQFCPEHFGVFYYGGILSRICRPCHRVLSTLEFPKNARDATGLHHMCRGCFKAKNLRLKLAALGAYGGGCTCCGEHDHRFLSIDHVDQDGAEHRRAIKSVGGYGFYYWLKNNDYPGGFQVMCFNCNHGRFINGGVCPHQEGANDGSQA